MRYLKSFLVDLLIITPFAVATFIWFFWYTGHLVARCNENACIIFLMMK